jgi:hypothetical protein
MKKIFLILFVFCATMVFAQEESENEPVFPPYDVTSLIENQTTFTPLKGSFEFVIHHRFGNFEDGISNLYGLYAPSNIRLGINYGITDNIMVGFGTEKDNKMQEFHGKWVPLTQSTNNKIPVTVALYGNIVIDGREESNFGANYSFTNRISYFSQILVSRAINFNFVVQAGANFSHFNSVEKKHEHDRMGITIGAKHRIINSIYAIAEYDHTLDIESLYEHYEPEITPEPNLSFGLEFGTTTHAFQVFVSNYRGIVPQQNFVFNQNEIGEFILGFNITARF